MSISMVFQMCSSNDEFVSLSSHSKVPTMEKRVSTLAQLGYKKCVVPKVSVQYLSTLDLGDMQIVGCKNLKEMINAVFRATG